MGQTSYKSDYYLWTAEQATMLKQGRLSELDIENLAEEIESMGKSEQRELQSRMKILICHLLKWKYQPTHRGNSWHRTIVGQRSDIPDVLETSPSLQNHLDDEVWLHKVWQSAVKLAAAETGLPLQTFPVRPLWSASLMLSDDFFPTTATP